MPLKKVLIGWIIKVIHGWLIFCVGGLAPLTFSTPLSPHRDVPSVSLAFLESPPHFSLTSTNSDPLLAWVQWLRKIQNFNSLTKTQSFESFSPSLVQFFQSNLSSGYLLNVGRACLMLHTCLFSLIALYILIGRSTLLSPLEKPPQSLLA